MNKKLLLVSLLSVGMLVGCGGGENQTSKPSNEDTPSSGETTPEKDETMGTYGHKGFYLFGTGNNWDGDFWTYDNAGIFYLKQEGDVYTLTGSVTAEDVKDGAKWEFKVREFDGEGKVFNWYPDGVDNNGVITEAGEYKFTFNPNSTEKAKKEVDGSEYTLFTKTEKLGEAKEENRLKLSTNRREDLAPVKGDAKLKLVLQGTKGALLEGEHLYAYGWQGQFENKLGEFLPVEESPDKYELTMPNIQIGLGPLDVTYEFNLLCSPVELTQESDIDWDTMKLSSPDGQNFKAIYNAKKRGATLGIDLANAKPSLSVEKAIEAMSALEESKVTETTLFVTGEVTKVYEDKQHHSWNLDLKAPDGKHFKIYSGKLSEGQESPIVGSVVKAFGRAKIFTKDDGTVYHQISWDKSHNVSPVVFNVWNPTPWYIKGDMNGWNAVPSFNLTQVNDTTFEIVCSLEEGKGFKVATPDWSKEVSAKQTTLAEGVPAENFELDKEAEKANIKVLVSGTYKLTLTVAEDGTFALTIALA